MSTLPFAAPRPDAESWPAEPADPARAEATAHAEPCAQAEPADVRQQVLGLKKKLEEAATDFGHLQSSLVSHQQLEQLLRQGRTHLQEMRTRLVQMTAERDRLTAELSEQKSAHQSELDRLHNQIEEATREALLQQTLAEQRERDMASEIDVLTEQLQKTTAERNRVGVQLEDREAAYKQFADERSEERFTFERLLAEATSNQREMVQERDEQRQQIETLREAAMRAQALARQIMRAHEGLPPEDRSS